MDHRTPQKWGGGGRLSERWSRRAVLGVDVRTRPLHPCAALADVRGEMRASKVMRRARFRESESGFALIEVMVSAVLVVVMSLAALAIIDKSGATSANNRMRDVASGLAAADQDTLRQQ